MQLLARSRSVLLTTHRTVLWTTSHTSCFASCCQVDAIINLCICSLGHFVKFTLHFHTFCCASCHLDCLCQYHIVAHSQRHCCSAANVCMCGTHVIVPCRLAGGACLLAGQLGSAGRMLRKPRLQLAGACISSERHSYSTEGLHSLLTLHSSQDLAARLIQPAESPSWHQSL